MRFAIFSLLVAAGIVAHCYGLQSSIPPINSSQAVSGVVFIGNPSNIEPLSPKFPLNPSLSLMHQDAGNTGSLDYPGPRGINLSVQSYAISPRVLLWGSDGALTAGMTNTSNGITTFYLAALNPDSLEIEARWTPPFANESLNFAYMALNQATNQITVSSKAGHIYVVQRSNTTTSPSLSLIRTIDLQESGTLLSGELLLNSIWDAADNIWFTTGSIQKQSGYPNSLGDPVFNSTTIGYIDPNGTIHALHLPNHFVENGIAVTGITIFCVTSPAGAADTANATGSLFSLSPGSGTDVTINWQTTYSAGSGRKPGGWTRGSGSTPSLLGCSYVAITDNADTQLHLLIYPQTSPSPSPSPICSTPIFTPGKGENDLGVLVHEENGTFALVVINYYNNPPLYSPSVDDLNAPNWNDLNGMASEIVRVDVTPPSPFSSSSSLSCNITWDTPHRITSVPVLSTATGLLYGYAQDEALAGSGVFVWYAVALDWRTGEEVWRVRTGAGGMYNDDYLPGTVGGDGGFWQGVVGGVVRVGDGEGGP